MIRIPLFLLSLALFLSCHKAEQLPELEVVDATYTEGTTAPVTIRLTPASTKDVTVRFQLSGLVAEAGSDFSPVPEMTLHFYPGETEKTIPIDIFEDTPGLEGDETFTVSLFAALNAVIKNAVTTLTIKEEVYLGKYLYFKIDNTTFYAKSNPEKIPAVFADSFFICGNKWPGNNGTSAILGIGKKTTVYQTNVDMYNFCFIGGQQYARFGANVLKASGFYIEYTDENGTVWKSQTGGQPPGWAFDITNRGMNSGNLYDFTFSGTFKCRLFDGAGNFKTLTTGKFYSPTPESF